MHRYFFYCLFQFCVTVNLGLWGSAHAAEGFRSPGWASTYSLLFPGVGQLVNGDSESGLIQMGSAFALSSAAVSYSEKTDFIKDNQRTATDAQGFTFEQTNETTNWYDFYGRLNTNLAFYSSYAALRDGYQKNGVLALGNGVPAPANDLSDLAAAPFKWSVLSKSEVWVPLAVALVGSQSEGAGNFYVDAGGLNKNTYIGTRLGANAYSTAIGEEAFFRGVVNTQTSAAWGPNWGLAGSALVFGLAHNGEGGSASVLQATVFGAYTGWMHQKNGYDLAPSTALHFWWNTFALLAIARDSKNFGSQQVRIAWAVPF